MCDHDIKIYDFINHEIFDLIPNVRHSIQSLAQKLRSRRMHRLKLVMETYGICTSS